MNEKANLEANRVYINTASDKVLYDRFCKDYNDVCINMHMDPDRETEQISCSQMSSLFLNLGFVTTSGLDQEQVMLINIWKIIGGDQEGMRTVNLHNAKVVMCSAQNFHIDWMIDMERPNDYESPNKVGRIDENGFLFLSPAEISHLTKKYIELYKKRQ
jgi:hypothetical protein